MKIDIVSRVQALYQPKHSFCPVSRSLTGPLVSLACRSFPNPLVSALWKGVGL